MKKILSLILCAVMLFAFSAISAVSADEPVKDVINPDRVIVTVNAEYVGKLDTLTPEDFPGVEIDRIKISEDCDYCFVIFLANPGEDKVYEACEVLSQNPIVKYADPDGHIPFDQAPPVCTPFADLTPGDWDMNGKTDAKDVKLAMLVYITTENGTEMYSQNIIYVFDVYRDGVVNLKDVARMMQYLAGWHEELVYVCPGFEDLYQPGFEGCFFD